MKVLAIGGTGFIGSFVLSRLLQRGDEITVFHRGIHVRDGVRAIQGDRHRLLNSTDALRLVQPDVIIDFVLSNGQQADDVVTIFRGYAGRIVALSSCDVYRAVGILHGTQAGDPDNSEITEDSPVRTQLHPYSATTLDGIKSVYPWVTDDYDKIPAENAVLHDKELPGTVLRLPMIYGPGDPLHRFFPIVKRVDDGRGTLLISESAAHWRGCRGYVEDIAAAVVLACADDGAAGRIYNVGDQENLTELDWMRSIAVAAGFKGRVAVVPDSEIPKHLEFRGNLRQHWAVSSRRIRSELGYSEETARSEALLRTIDWERAHPLKEIPPEMFDYAAEDAALQPEN